MLSGLLDSIANGPTSYIIELVAPRHSLHLGGLWQRTLLGSQILPEETYAYLVIQQEEATITPQPIRAANTLLHAVRDLQSVIYSEVRNKIKSFVCGVSQKLILYGWPPVKWP